jgi:hypothetical protein
VTTTSRNGAVRTLSEAAFMTRVIDYARLRGWRVAHFRPARTAAGWRTPLTGDAGFPDLVIARRGDVRLIELKSSTGRPTAAQLAWLHAAGSHGALWRPDDWPLIVQTLK